MNDLLNDLNMYRNATKTLTVSLHSVSAIWSDNKYHELSSEITEMIKDISAIIIKGDDLKKLFNTYLLISEEEF